MHRLDRINALKPANPLDFRSLTLRAADKQIGRFKTVSHHGSDTSGSEALVYALRPRVAIMNNGTRKGGALQTFKILRNSPGLKDLWQNHYSVAAGEAYNMPDAMIANLEELGASPNPVPVSPQHMGAAYWIKLSARSDGSFAITNSRNGHSKAYPSVK